MFKYLLVFLLLGFTSKEQSILWSEDYRLDWSDFKGAPNYNSDAVAITASGLSFGLTAKTTSSKLLEFTATVEARFYPDQSWYKKEHVNNIILAHEQLHFDITELHARKFRKQIAETNFTVNIKSELNHLNKKINKELKAYQEKYDSESNYSRTIEAQKQWQILIKQELKKLSKYK